MGKRKMSSMERCLLALLVLVAGAQAYDGCLQCSPNKEAVQHMLIQSQAEADTIMPSDVASKYHSTADIYQKIEALASNCQTGVLSITGDDGRVSGYSNKVETLKNGNPTKRLLVNFNMHGRELITGETALALAQAACGTGNSQFTQDQVKAILATTEIKYVPVLNKAGRSKSEGVHALSTGSSGSCTEQRKNADRVDPNRNFEFQWREASVSGSIDSETYPGETAMTAPEVKFMHSLAQEFNPDGYLDVHAGEDAMGWPFGYNADVAPPNEDKYNSITSTINSEVFGPGGQTRWAGRLAAMGDDLAYNSYGCACDYFSQREKNGQKILSMTWEIWSETRSKQMLSQGGLQHVNTEAGNEGKLSVPTASETEATADVSMQVKPAFKPEAPDRALSNLLQEDEKSNPEVDPQNQKQAEFLAKEQQLAAEEIAKPEVAVQEPPMNNALMPQPALTKEIKLAEVATTTEVQDMSANSCFLYFNPPTVAKYDKTVKEWADAILVYAREL